MANFDDQVMGLTGLTISGSSTAPSQSELSTFLNDGVIDVTNRVIMLRPQDIDNFLREGAEQTSNGFNPGSSKIISVVRENGTNNQWYPCKKSFMNLQYRVTDTESLHYASKYNPVYMISQNRNVHVYPEPSSDGNDTFKVLYVNYSPEESDGTALIHSSSGIKWFPDDKVYLVVLYASIKSLQSALSSVNISTFSLSASAPSSIPSVPSISGGSVGAITIDALPSAPDYTTPTQTISGVDWATEYPSQASAITTALAKIITSVENAEDEIEDATKMTANIVLGVAEVTESAVDTDTSSSEMKTSADAIATALGRISSYNWDDEDTFTTGSSQLTRVKAALDNAEDVINSNQPSATTDAYGALADEDTEIVQGALSIAATEIQRAQAHLAEWNTILQGAGREAQGFASEVQARGTWTSAKAQVWNGYFASASAYAQAAQTYLASAQGYSAEIQTRLSATPIKIQEYQAKVQDALNVFNEGNAVYQAAIQRNLQQAQINMQDAQKEADLTLQAAIQDYTLELQRVSTDAQKYQSLVAAEVQTYQQEIAEKSAEYQWQVSRLQDLKQEYNQAFAIMAPPQQQAQPQRRARA